MFPNKLGCARWASATPPIRRTVDPVGAEIQIGRTAIYLISVCLFQVRLIPIRLIPIGLIQIRLLAIQGKELGVSRGIAQRLKVRSALSARRTTP
jgi:hypothetical protein